MTEMDRIGARYLRRAGRTMQTHASASRLLLLVMIIGVVLHAGGAASAADSTSGIVLHLRP
jgi:hypothetical protein